MKEGIRLIRSGPDPHFSQKLGTVRRTCLLVPGMHRSGTSALTRMLSLLGCDLPKTLMGANQSNEAGHWESTTISDLNDRILESAGSKWDDWLAFNPGWMKSPAADAFREEARAALRQEFAASGLFVLKDPRICRLAPLWLSILDETGIQTLVMLPVRNPLEVAASLQSRNGFDPAYGHLLWLRHVLDAEFETRGRPRLFAGYDRLLHDWPHIAVEAQNAFGLTWPRFTDRIIEQIDGFLTEEYRHHREEPRRVIDNPALSTWLRDSFRILNHWTEAGEQPDDYPALDRIRTEFNAAAPAFVRVIATGRAAARQVQQLDEDLAIARARAEKLEGELADAHRTNGEQEQRITRMQEELDTAHGQLSEKDAQITRREAELEQQFSLERAENEKLLTGFKEHVELLLKDIKEHQAARAALEVKLGDTVSEKDRELAASEQRFRESQAELKKVREETSTELDAKAEEIARMQREREADQSVHQKQIADLEKISREAQSEAERAGTEKRELESRLQGRFDEIAILTQLLRDEEEKTLAAKAAIRRAIRSLLDSNKGTFPTDVARLRHKIKLLKSSGLFDAEWYLQNYPDVAEEGADPYHHYIEHGLDEDREPNALLPGRENE